MSTSIESPTRAGCQEPSEVHILSQNTQPWTWTTLPKALQSGFETPKTGDSTMSLGPGSTFGLSLSSCKHLMFQLVPAASGPPTMQEPSYISSVLSRQCWRCCWVPPKPSLLTDEPAVVPQPLLSGQGLQPRCLGSLP